MNNDIYDFRGKMPESWCCIDCGTNTAPGMMNRAMAEDEARRQGPGYKLEQTISKESEVYTVRSSVWKKAGLEAMGGCLCIGCLEKRLRRKLKPNDFLRDHPFNQPHVPGTPRLLSRRRGRRQ